MATKKQPTPTKTPTKRKNPPDATHRNLRAAKAHIDRLDRGRVRTEATLKALTKRVGKLRFYLVAELAGLRRQVAVVERARGRLEERVHALEGRWSFEVTGPTMETLTYADRRVVNEIAKRKLHSKVTPQEAGVAAPADEPRDFTPPNSKAARRKGVS